MALTKLAIFDVAGTTAKDDDLVVRAFQKAVIGMGVEPDSADLAEKTDYVNATMGQRKIDVFLHLFDGDLDLANQAHDKFVAAYIELVSAGELEEFEGISDFFRELRNRGIGIAITTGFPREILDRILTNLNWLPLIDVSVASSEVDEGRPAPDMIFRSIELFNVTTGANVSSEEIVVVGDTQADMQSGVRAGAPLVVGVTSGAHSATELAAAGATTVLIGSTELLSLLG